MAAATSAACNSSGADERCRVARRDYNMEQQEWGWARPAPVSQKSGGDASSSPKKARRKVSRRATLPLSCPPLVGTGLYARAPCTCPLPSQRGHLPLWSGRVAVVACSTEVVHASLHCCYRCP